MEETRRLGVQERTDFFISYTGRDRAWAEWIAWQLETARYTCLIQAWDFRAGTNFVAEMDDASKRANRTVPVLSEAYLQSEYAFAEWAVAFRADPKGKEGRVLPVRVERCEVEGLLGPIVYIDLVDLDEQQAREQLLAGVRRERAKPARVAFPGSVSSSTTLSLERPVFPGTLPTIWNVPYPQNPLFTGREELLSALTTALQTMTPTALSQPYAVSGLGGIGKTQLALEYAYRSRHHYQAVLWAVADTRDHLTSSYLSFAASLHLPVQGISESEHIIAAVKRWLQTQRSWLLILDNADDLTLARDFLPPILGGHVLLTTRAQATGRFARRLEVPSLATEQGVLFLLRRAGVLAFDASLEEASSHDQQDARALCEQLGGLPLALDQAGAYIEETGSGLAEYVALYERRRADLLAEKRRGLVDDHPLSVSATFSLAFEHVERNDAAAADLLRVCAFLAPDAIPETIIREGASHLGPHLASIANDPYSLNQAIEVLRASSLVHREVGSEKSYQLSVHRLVQAVLQDQMDEQDRDHWREQTIRAVAAALPGVEHGTWPLWERLLAHALVCAEMIKYEGLQFAEATHVLRLTGWYLSERARYQEAQPLLEHALSISEQVQGKEHIATARASSTLAVLYQDQGKYAEAEPLLQRALQIREQQLGSEHPDTATSLNNLALLYQDQGKYAEAEPLLQRALQIREQQSGPEHPDTAVSLNNLALLYGNQRKDAEAEPLLQRALQIREQQLGPEHPDTATSLNNLAVLYRNQGKDAEAEPLLQRALQISEQQLGSEHPRTLTVRANYSILLQRIRREE